MEATAKPVASDPAKRRGVVTALLIFTTFLAFVGMFSIWANRQALNTDNWTDTSTKLLEDPDIQEQVATFLVTQLYANVDVQAELEQALPPAAQPLAGPAAGGLRQLAQRAALTALATPQVQSLWAEANRTAHEDLLTVINGGSEVVSTGGGNVVLNLRTLVAQLAARTGVSADVASKLPASAGSITILRSDELSAAQDIAKLIKGLAIVLTILVFGLYALAVYLARGRRRETLRSVGFGFAIAGILALVVRGFAGDQVTGALASSDAVKPAVDAVWSIGTSLLVTITVSAITFGILLVIGAWLAGPTRPATALRREAAPYFRERPGATYAVVALVFLALILWAPVAAFHKLIGLLLLAGLMVLGTEALRRQTAVEFPDADFGGFGDRVRGGIGGGNGAAEPQPPAPQSKVEQLERLSALREKGTLSDQEFEAAKAEVLGSAAKPAG